MFSIGVSRMKGEIGALAIVILVLMAIVPLTYYYLGTLAGVDFSAFAVDLVYMGGFLSILFLAVAALVSWRRR